MSLLDLSKSIQRKKNSGGVSFVSLIDKFLYAEQLALLHGKVSRLDIERQEARILFKLAKARLLSLKAKDTAYREVYIHPSSVSSCARRLYYKRFGAPENRCLGPVSAVAQLQRVFANGSYTHLRLQILFIRMGICGFEDIEVGYTEGDMQGTCDAIATVEGRKYIVDLKTANSNTFRTLGTNAKSRYFDGYDGQMSMYMDHFKIHRGVVLYENKDSQVLHESFLTYDEKAKCELFDRIDYVRRCFKDPVPPKREGEGLTQWPCSKCPFTNVCFTKGVETKWLTSLAKQKAKQKLPRLCPR